jgi:hypothetical protein
VTSLPPPGTGKPERLDGRRFTIGLLLFFALAFAGFMALREKRMRDWSAAGGDRIREGVTLPVRRR